MARRRGFLAEYQHQVRLAEQRDRAAQRQYETSVRQAQAAQRSAERAQAAYLRASEADRKRLEKEAAAAHVEAMQAEVDSRNVQLTETYTEIDGLLTATLAIDDFVDLESLRVVVRHPPFSRDDLRVPIPAPAPIPDPPLPVKREPQEPTGLFGRKKKVADAQAAVEAQYATDYYAWQAYTQELPGRRASQQAHYEEAERKRQHALDRALDSYRIECEARETEASKQNAELDELIAALGYGVVEAVQEYVGIVLANSVYPEDFPVSHEATFDPSNAELRLRVIIPGPAAIPTIKTYRYVKASDEITSSDLSQKDQKDRYLGVVNNVSLRSLHEVFEADRRGLVQAISLELGTETISPATGREVYVPFVVASVARGPFMELDLSAVTPSATLEHLRAVVSNNPFALTPISTTGVRKA
jgi:restriction system protein